MRRLALAIVCLVLAAPAGRAAAPAAPASSAGRAIRPVDDQGRPIRAALAVCTIRGLERSCRTFQGAGALLRLEGFDAVSAEGPEHGPAAFRRQELPVDRDGSWRLVVPRKALLELRGLPAARPAAVLSLYRKDDRDFRRPALRVSSPPGELRIPAGEAVVSLAVPGKAPDLHLVSAPPGGRIAVEYRPRPGWSLLVRAGDEATGQPLDQARVEVTAAAGYGEAPPATARTERFGLAALCGLSPRIATAAVRRPGYVERREPGLSATPGSFSFREVRLERPGAVVAAIRLEGRPAAGAPCRIQEPVPDSSAGPRREPPRVLFDGKADPRGTCRATGLPRGEYLLRAAPPGPAVGASARQQAVRVEPGRETAVEVDLRPIPVHGTVRRGEDPAPGYRVKVRGEGPAGGLEEIAEAETDEDGEYEATLWDEGQYVFLLFDGSGTLADVKRVWVDAGGATRDFRLAGCLEGRVTDREGHPVGGAAVLAGLRRQPASGQAESDDGGTFRGWNVQTDEQGRFSLLLEAVAGRLTVTAHKAGFRASEPVEMPVDGQTAPPPVSLVLERSDDLAGVLVSAAGSPVAGAWLAAFDLAGEAAVQLGETRSGPDGGFSLPRARGAMTYLFYSGPGCPLGGAALPRDDEAGARPLSLACSPAPATLELTLLDPQGRPLPQRSIALRRGAEILPAMVLAAHLAGFGLPAATDAAGSLVVPGLTPGEYEVYLAGSSNPATLAAGLPYGRLAAASLAPLATAELEVTVEAE